MKQGLFILWLVTLSLLLVHPLDFLNAASTPAWSVYFSPDGSFTDAIVKELGRTEC